MVVRAYAVSNSGLQAEARTLLEGINVFNKSENTSSSSFAVARYSCTI